MKRYNKIYVIAGLLLLVVSVGLNIVYAVNQGPDPGSDQDPIVSKSYVDLAISELAEKVQLLLEQNDALKNLNAQLTTRIDAQEQNVKALQEALKTGAVAGAVGTGKDPGASLGKATVNVDVLNLRKQPNTTSAILAKLLKNETLTLVSKSGDWYAVTTSKGINGYVKGSLITIKK